MKEKPKQVELATPQATQTLAKQFENLVYKPLGLTGLWVSQAGFGSYRVDPSSETHRDALIHALEKGINLIDTSANYWDGGSEILIGSVLSELERAHKLERQSLVLVTKGGYLQGQNLEASQRRQADGNPFPEVVELDTGLAYCIHPTFLEDQLTQSLGRLQLPAVDVYLLHNPEYLLTWALREGQTIEQARQFYYTRLQAAFLYLESEVEKGRIGWYGISSNTLPKAFHEDEATSLDKIMETLPKKNHFAVIQFPMNLLEPQAATLPHGDHQKTLLDIASEYRLGVLTNRPLNAFSQKGLFRLADLAVEREVGPEEIMSLIQQFQVVEMELQSLMEAEPDQEPHESFMFIQNAFTVARSFHEIWDQFTGYGHWKEVLNTYLLPRLEQALLIAERDQLLHEETQDQIKTYIQAFKELNVALSTYYKNQHGHQAQNLSNKIGGVDKDWAKATSLTHKALRALRTSSGIHTVLVGMRSKAYVDDALHELTQPVEIRDRSKAWQSLANSTPSA